MKTLPKGPVVKDKQVISLMRYYELIKEKDNVGKNKLRST